MRSDADSQDGQCRYKAFIFDLDGLLIDSESVYQQSRTLAATEFGFEIEPEFYFEVLAGHHLGDCREVIERKANTSLDFAQFQDRCMALVADISDSVGFKSKLGAHELLSFASTLGPCAVASGSNAEHVHNALTNAGLLSYFDAVVSRDSVEQGKPNPELFQKAAACIDMECQLCLAFEDANSGVLAAHRANMDVVMVPDRQHPNRQSQSIALAVLASLDEAIVLLSARAG